MNVNVHLKDLKVGVTKFFSKAVGEVSFIQIEDGKGNDVCVYGTPQQFAEIGRKIHETLMQWEGDKIQSELKQFIVKTSNGRNISYGAYDEAHARRSAEQMGHQVVQIVTLKEFENQRKAVVN